MVYFCPMRYPAYLIMFFLVWKQPLSAQKKWNLAQCIEYAMANNLTVKQTDLQTKLAELTFRQSKLGQYPNLSFTAGPSYNSGRNQDPTSFSLITQSYLSANMQLQSSAEIFNWYSKRNTIAANRWEVEAAKAGTDKLKNDIALSVANAYLQILLAREQEKIAGVQVQQSQSQLSNTRKLVDAGALPELNASELEAQVARDSATFITATGAVEQNILNLKSYMAIDAADPFEVETPPVELIPVEKISDLQPDAVYALAMANMPQQRANDFKLKAVKKIAEAARGNKYPAISVFGSLSSNFINSKSPVYELTGTYSSNALSPQVVIGGTSYKVTSPDYAVSGKKGTPFFTQLNNNFRQSIGLSLSVPIFTGGNLRTAYEKSKINIQNQELQIQLDDQKLKQDIYQAYNAARVALEKFNAAEKSMQTAERSFSFSQKRYDVGLLSTFELITNQNNLFRSKLEYVLDQFDYVFKMKVLEFYKGQGLKL